jgi:hypothetical protein
MKITKILAIAGIISLAAAGTVLAANGTAVTFNDSTSTVGTPAASVKVSKNVSVKYIPEAAGLTYSMSSFHTSGTKTYGTSSGDTKIYMMDSTALTDPPDAPAANTSADFASWTSM